MTIVISKSLFTTQVIESFVELYVVDLILALPLSMSSLIQFPEVPMLSSTILLPSKWYCSLGQLPSNPAPEAFMIRSRELEELTMIYALIEIPRNVVAPE